MLVCRKYDRKEYKINNEFYVTHYNQLIEKVVR